MSATGESDIMLANPQLQRLYKNNTGNRGQLLELDRDLTRNRQVQDEAARAREDITGLGQRAMAALDWPTLKTDWRLVELTTASDAAEKAKADLYSALSEDDRDYQTPAEVYKSAMTRLKAAVDGSWSAVRDGEATVKKGIKTICKDNEFNKRLTSVLNNHQTHCNTLRGGVNASAEGLQRRLKRSNTDFQQRIATKLAKRTSLKNDLTTSKNNTPSAYTGFGQQAYDRQRTREDSLNTQIGNIDAEIQAESSKQDTSASFRDALDRLRLDSHAYAENTFADFRTKLSGPEMGCRELQDRERAEKALRLLLDMRMQEILRTAGNKFREVLAAEDEFARRMELGDPSSTLASGMRAAAEFAASDVERELRSLQLVLETAHGRVVELVVRNTDRALALFKPTTGLVYAFKLTRVITAYVAGYATQKAFDDYFVKRLKANGTRAADTTPPDLGWFVAVYATIQALFDCMVGAGIWFMTRVAMDNDGVLVDYAFDTAVSLVLASSSLLWIANIVQDNRYFEYRSQTPRATRLMREMCVAVTLAHSTVPYFFLIGPFASIRSIAITKLTNGRTGEKKPAATPATPATPAAAGAAPHTPSFLPATLGIKLS